jgi:hypothetical protein
MATYTITGPFHVLDKQPGETLTSDELAEWNTDWLIETGHIVADDAATPSEAIPAEVPATEAAPADTNKEG